MLQVRQLFLTLTKKYVTQTTPQMRHTGLPWTEIVSTNLSQEHKMKSLC